MNDQIIMSADPHNGEVTEVLMSHPTLGDTWMKVKSTEENSFPVGEPLGKWKFTVNGKVKISPLIGMALIKANLKFVPRKLKKKLKKVLKKWQDEKQD